MITFPNAVKDKFILVASRNRSPLDPVFVCLYDPAKSTRLNLDPISFSPPLLFYLLFSMDSTYMVRIECDRLDSEFIRVSAKLRSIITCGPVVVA